MISTLAHQWRQPLARITSFNANTKLKQSLGMLENGDIDEMLEKQNEQIKYINRIINDFSAFLKCNNTKGLASIKSIINNTCMLTESLSHLHNVKCIYDYKIPEDTQIMTIQSKFEQVILNLYKNSLDQIISTNQQNGKIKISVYQDNQHMVFEFLDNAGGISEDIIDKIFNPYFTTKSQTSQHAGIGLYISKLIIENYLSGTIEAYNQEDGACFKISISVVN